MPPLTMEELFGAEEQQPNQQAEAQEEGWDNFDPFAELMRAAEHGVNRGASEAHFAHRETLVKNKYKQRQDQEMIT